MASVKVENLPKNLLKLTITVPVDEVQPYMEEAAIRLSEKSAIPGFRPGKAGYDIVKQRLGEGKILEEALEAIVRKTYTEVIMSDKIETVGSPKIEMEKMAPGNDLIYTAEVARLPAITRLADYKKLKITPKSTKVEDKDVEKALDELRHMQTKEVRAAAGKTVTANDKVVIAIDMKKGGVPVEGGQSPNHVVYMQEDHYVPGMKEQLIGLKEGDHKVFTIPFPKDHTSKFLAGENIDFVIDVKEIFNLETPPADEEFAKAVGQKDLATLKGLLRTNLEKEKVKEEERRQEKELLEKLAEDSRFEDIPDLLLNEEINKMVRELQSAVEDQGMDFENYVQSLKKTLAELKMEFTPQALTRIKIALVMREVAKRENVEVSEKEIDDELDTLAERYEDKDARKQIYSPMYREYVETILKNRKVLAVLKEAMTKK